MSLLSTSNIVKIKLYYEIKKLSSGAEKIIIFEDDEAKKLMADRGVQEFSLIHDPEGGGIIPNRIVVQQGIPVKVYNTSLNGDAKVSIEPFYTAAEVNVKGGSITIFEFTPNVGGEFTIRYDDHDATGTLVVEQ